MLVWLLSRLLLAAPSRTWLLLVAPSDDKVAGSRVLPSCEHAHSPPSLPCLPPPPASLPCLPAPQLRAYQRRSLSHMLSEERAAGGTGRSLWVRFNLPQNPGERLLVRLLEQPVCWPSCPPLLCGHACTAAMPCCSLADRCCSHADHCCPPVRASPPAPPAIPTELHCYVSPVLREVRISTSRIEAEQWTHSCGGCGWIALEVSAAAAALLLAAALLCVQAGCGSSWARRASSMPEHTTHPPCACAPPPTADGHGQNGGRNRRDTDEPAARRLAPQPRVPKPAPAGPPV